MAEGQKSTVWGGVLKGVAMVAGTVAVGIVVSSVAGFALTGLGTWMAGGANAVVGANAAAGTATAASGWVGWGTTIANIGAGISGFTSWVTELVVSPFTKGLDWITGAKEGATYTKAAYDTLELGTVTAARTADAAKGITEITTAAAQTNLAGNLTGSAARAGVGLAIGATAAGASTLASRTDRTAAQKQAIGKFTERVLQERELAQLIGPNRQA